MEQQRSLDRLVTVSKVFRDARVAELRRENEELRLQLFWRDCGVEALANAIHIASESDKSPECTCSYCLLNGRAYGRTDQLVLDTTCKYAAWLQNIFASCDLVWGHVTSGGTVCAHVCNGNGPVLDVDCHLVNIQSCHGDWSDFTYGSRLWKAKSINDPELKKLQKLFEALAQSD
jgi:hypothetical protein